jgi:pilus assembly protein Flp/PilA
MRMLHRVDRGEEGANLVEYALLITLIAAVVLIGVGALGDAINDWFQALADLVSGWVTDFLGG